jgi:ribosomal protein S18 acetylase RimI-like enzyme
MSRMKLSVTEAVGADDTARARQLFLEYASSLGTDLAFQDFEQELASLPGAYAPPGGRLLLGRAGEELAGCVAMRPLAEDVCEMKRLYVRPAYRSLGAGRQLAEAIVQAAKDMGYGRMRLDTLPEMAAAQRLYRELGFRSIAPYRFNPIEGTEFLELQVRMV